MKKMLILPFIVLLWKFNLSVPDLFRFGFYYKEQLWENLLISQQKVINFQNMDLKFTYLRQLKVMKKFLD
ncbi:uncharacterized protein LLCC_0624 [Lactococcus cremoris]|uniref:Uncharacterized protein n=1 Tax=Lactococcus lactis subsp. cremoris TaxID=1359 RepID=A0AAD1JZN7_LACLC|nr:uncharacterized protein LLCC_0624 [Lactococcus cremoris]BCO03693.1 hypothetical protein LLG32_17870 [Lactococcus cremoris]BCO06545.1 hypothetical protein LLC_17850 [Lactococcus cremoris]